MIHVSLYNFTSLFSFHIYWLFSFILFVSTISHENEGVWFLSNRKKNKKKMNKIFSICFNARNIFVLKKTKQNNNLTGMQSNISNYIT